MVIRHGLSAVVLAMLASACGGAAGDGEGGERTLENGTLPPETPGDEVAPPPPPATQSPAPQPAPEPITAPPSASDYDKEKTWAEAHGVPIPAGKVTVVAKRRGSDARSEQYQDEMVVFRPDGTIARFVATTKPAQMPSPGSSVVPDVNGDGRKDLGIVRPGIYEAKGNEWFGIDGYERRAFRVLTTSGSGALPAWRDTSGDGVFSAKEKQAAEQLGYKITGVLIHYGFAPNGTTLGQDTYVGPWSVGCQNVPYAELDRFIQAVGGASASFTYAIVQE